MSHAWLSCMTPCRGNEPLPGALVKQVNTTPYRFTTPRPSWISMCPKKSVGTRVKGAKSGGIIFFN